MLGVLSSAEKANLAAALTVGSRSRIDDTLPVGRYFPGLNPQLVEFLHHDDSIMPPSALPPALRVSPLEGDGIVLQSSSHSSHPLSSSVAASSSSSTPLPHSSNAVQGHGEYHTSYFRSRHDDIKQALLKNGWGAEFSDSVVKFYRACKAEGTTIPVLEWQEMILPMAARNPWIKEDWDHIRMSCYHLKIENKLIPPALLPTLQSLHRDSKQPVALDPKVCRLYAVVLMTAISNAMVSKARAYASNTAKGLALLLLSPGAVPLAAMGIAVAGIAAPFYAASAVSNWWDTRQYESTLTPEEKAARAERLRKIDWTTADALTGIPPKKFPAKEAQTTKVVTGGGVMGAGEDRDDEHMHRTGAPSSRMSPTPLPTKTGDGRELLLAASPLAVLASGEWRVPVDQQLSSILEKPRRNQKTGLINARISLQGDSERSYRASIRKIPIYPEDLILARSLPVEMDAFKRQVKLFLEDNKSAHGDQLPSLVDKLDDIQLRMYLQDISPEVVRAAVKRQLKDSPNNGAYLEPLALLIGRCLTAQKLATFFPCMYSSFEALDHHFYQEKQAKHNPVECVFVVTDKLGETAARFFERGAMSGLLTGADIYSVLAQVVVNLALVQSTCGMVLCNLSASSVRARQEEPGSCMYVQWGDHLLEIPATLVWQHTDWTQSSFVWQGVRLLSLESQSLLEHRYLPYQADLLSFARSVRPFIEGLPAADVDKAELLKMTDRWFECQILNDRVAASVGAENEATSSGEAAAVVRLMDLESAVCRSSRIPLTDEGEEEMEQSPSKTSKECQRSFLSSLDAATTCTNAIPFLQVQQFAKYFTSKVVPKEDVIHVRPVAVDVSQEPHSSSK